MKKIILYRLFKTDTLLNRELVKQVFRTIQDNKLVIDFNKISFISKSFAHEILTAIRKKDLDVEFINVSENVQIMLDVAFNKPYVTLKMHRAVNLATC